MDTRDPTNEGLWGEYELCHFCQKREWPDYQMKETPWGELICPNCRGKCDYCEEYYHWKELTRVADGKACSDCMCDHDLEPLDELELFDTLHSCLI